MRIATLSSAYSGDSKKAGVSDLQVDQIMSTLKTLNPDVLVTAGCSIKNKNNLYILEKFFNLSMWNGIIFVEVSNFYKKRKFNHCLFAWTRDGGWKNLGGQHFSTSKEAALICKDSNEFEKNLHKRVIEFNGIRFGALICGEINALVAGKNGVIVRTKGIENWLKEIDFIVNPTHDQMGRQVLLNAKRTWISSGGRFYVSSSNWNLDKNQKNHFFHLHSFFYDSLQIDHKSMSGTDGLYECRFIDIDDGNFPGLSDVL